MAGYRLVVIAMLRHLASVHRRLHVLGSLLSSSIVIAAFLAVLSIGLIDDGTPRRHPASDQSAMQFLAVRNLAQTGYDMGFLWAGSVGSLVTVSLLTSRIAIAAPDRLTVRSRLILFLILAVVASVIIMEMLWAAVFGAWTGGILAGYISGFEDLRSAHGLATRLVWAAPVALFVTLSYIMVASAIATVFENLWAGVVSAIGWMMAELALWDRLAALDGAAGWLGQVTPVRVAAALLATNGPIETLIVKNRQELPATGQSVAVMAAYLTVASIVTLIGFLRREAFSIDAIPERTLVLSGEFPAADTSPPR
ncbi:MAG: hypothetical protein U0531_00395 [Dehalococcoidia bacterium]